MLYLLEEESLIKNHVFDHHHSKEQKLHIQEKNHLKHLEMASDQEEIKMMEYTVVYCSGKRVQEPTDPKPIQKKLLNGDGWITEKL